MYSLDVNAARKSDTNGATIKELGKYVGEFVQAKDIDTKKGGKGIEFIFKSAAGQKAKLSIYTTGANGDKYQGFETLMAIMTCMQVKSIRPQEGVIVRYDRDTKKEVQEKGQVFAELCKPIGLLLETEDYVKQDGSGIGTQMVLKHAFNAANEFTATEILDRKTQPEELAKMVANLRHRPVKGAPARHSQQSGYQDQPSNFEMDSDIPF